MSYSSLGSNYYQNKIPVNGVTLVNRYELSPNQDRELQRFIDNNAHILQWKDREISNSTPIQRQSRRYDEARRTLSRGPSPFEGAYNSLRRNNTNDERNKTAEFVPNQLPSYPNIEGHSYTYEFPGLEYPSDNSFIEDLIKQGQVTIGSTGLISQPTSRCGSSLSVSQNLPAPATRLSQNNYYSIPPDASSTRASTEQPISSGPQRGVSKTHSTLPPTSPYSSLKRKGVSWLDQERERARSLSPGFRHSNSRNFVHSRPNSVIHTSSHYSTYS